MYACEWKREACFSRALGDTVLHANGLAQVSRKRQQQRSLGYARDNDTRGGIVSTRGGIECLGEAQFAIADESQDDGRLSSPCVISSDSEKSFSLAVKRCMRVNGNGKPVFPVHWGIRCFMQTVQQSW